MISSQLLTQTKSVLSLLDCSAAFDLMSHSTLLHRLNHRLGIKDTDWFRSYLTSRTQSVSLTGHTSPPTPYPGASPKDRSSDLSFSPSIPSLLATLSVHTRLTSTSTLTTPNSISFVTTPLTPPSTKPPSPNSRHASLIFGAGCP